MWIKILHKNLLQFKEILQWQAENQKFSVRNALYNWKKGWKTFMNEVPVVHNKLKN